MNRCGSFPLLSAPHSLFSIWTDVKRSENIPGAPTWRGGEWIWLSELSGPHRNSTQGLNSLSVLSGFLTRLEIRKLQSPLVPIYVCIYIYIYIIHHHSEYFAQGQVLHCKRRNLDCSSAKGRSSTANSGTKATVLPGI